MKNLLNMIGGEVSKTIMSNNDEIDSLVAKYFFQATFASPSFILHFQFHYSAITSSLKNLLSIKI